MGVTSVLIFKVLVSFAIITNIYARSIDQDKNVSHSTNQTILGEWYVIAAISPSPRSIIPKCVMWNFDKNIYDSTFDITFYEMVPYSEGVDVNSDEYLDLSDGFTKNGICIEYLNNSQVVLRRNGETGYVLLSRRINGISKELHGKYSLYAKENNLVYIMIDQDDCPKTRGFDT